MVRTHGDGIYAIVNPDTPTRAATFIGKGEYVIGLINCNGEEQHVEVASDTLDARQRIQRLIAEDEHWCETYADDSARYREVFAINHNGRKTIRERHDG